MANSFFKFKQFTIHHDLCAMKVGTDGVLLGAWATVADHACMADVGTGTGLIALMLAQRCHATIDAIDVDVDAVQQAIINCEASPFGNQITPWHIPFCDFVTCGKQYDLIVSNPPYFDQSLKCPDEKRCLARHNDTLSLQTLLAGCSTLLKPEGRVALVLPFNVRREVIHVASENGLHCVRETAVIPVVGAFPKRLLIEFSSIPMASPSVDTLVIEEARHQYTPEYIALTRDFYLKM